VGIMPRYIFIFFFNFSVFDVMLQSISSHRAEGASPPSPRCRYSKKCIYIRYLDVTGGDSQSSDGPCSRRDTPSASWDYIPDRLEEYTVVFGCTGALKYPHPIPISPAMFDVELFGAFGGFG
jgi:hypothetical protein